MTTPKGIDLSRFVEAATLTLSGADVLPVSLREIKPITLSGFFDDAAGAPLFAASRYREVTIEFGWRWFWTKRCTTTCESIALAPMSFTLRPVKPVIVQVAPFWRRAGYRLVGRWARHVEDWWRGWRAGGEALTPSQQDAQDETDAFRARGCR